MQGFEPFEERNDWRRGQSDDMLMMTGAVEHRLEIVPHGAEYLRPYVEGVIHRMRILRHAE